MTTALYHDDWRAASWRYLQAEAGSSLRLEEGRHLVGYPMLRPVAQITLRRWLHRDRVRCVAIGQQWYIRGGDFVAWLRARRPKDAHLLDILAGEN